MTESKPLKNDFGFRNTYGKYQKFCYGLTSIPISVKTKKWLMEKIGLVVTPVGGKRHKKKLYKNINRVVENDGCGVIEGDFKCKKQEELDKQQMCDPNFQPTRNKTKI